MKNNIIMFVSILILFYLVGYFIETSFNIAEWRENVRALVAVFGLFLATAMTGAYSDLKK